MLNKQRTTLVANEQGAALLLVLVMLTALLGSAGWLAMQTRTETAIVATLKDYSKAFNAADGSWWISFNYLFNVGIADEHPGGTPKIGGSEVAVSSSYRNFINNKDMQDVIGSTDNIQSMARVILVRTLDNVTKGEGITSDGYKSPTTYWYKLVGEGRLKFDLTDGSEVDKASSKVSALVFRTQ